MRRLAHMPGFDMIPMMGLCAVLIPMALMAWGVELRVVETHLPGM